jgi:DNA invertase Pin-like site-specific DNA recombinase
MAAMELARVGELNLSQPRVATFYRVSTKGQMDGDDIPMQRRSCRDFIDKQGWTLVKEYTEKGVSGYKVSASNRDEIQRAKADAEAGLYDILLVFMFDRLGRKQDETPFVLKWFSKQGVQTWSVKEGQQKFEDHSDDLINFIRFWQSSGESKKTSMRVNEKHMQMVEDGEYRGGTVPYGYSLVKSGVTNKKGKELMTPIVNEEQSKIVQQIFTWVHEEGYGSLRIAKALNEQGVRTQTGSKWTAGSINFILTNPMYKGIMTYGKRKSDAGIFAKQDKEDWVLSKAIPELAIINEAMWEKVQKIRSSRSPKNTKRNDVERTGTTRSPLLFVGLAKCGHCGSPLTTTYNTKTYTTVGGETKKQIYAKYRCSGKAQGRTACDGQTVYAPTKLEGLVLEEVDGYLERLRKVDLDAEIKAYKKKSSGEDDKELKKLQSAIEISYNELAALNNEVAKSIMGNSSFKPEMLSKLIEQKEIDISKMAHEIKELDESMTTKKVEANDLETLQKHIPVWKQMFEEASKDKKKMMLHTIIDKVHIFREHIKLDVKLTIEQFIGSDYGSVSSSAGRVHRWQR